jgi:hypothetical protein
MDQSGEGLVGDLTFRHVVINGHDLIDKDPIFKIEGGVTGINVE